MFQTETEKIKTRISSSIYYFPRKSCNYELCEKERVRFCVSAVPMVAPTRLNVTLHVQLFNIIVPYTRITQRP